MDKQKLAKIVVKTAIGMVGSLAIGTLIKGERLAGSKVDAFFEGRSNPTEN